MDFIKILHINVYRLLFIITYYKYFCIFINYYENILKINIICKQNNSYMENKKSIIQIDNISNNTYIDNKNNTIYINDRITNRITNHIVDLLEPLLHK